MTWYAQAKFWTLFYEWMFPPESFGHASEQIAEIESLTGMRQGKVLDLCCGPGRHSIPLSKHGYEVTAVDLQPFLLGKAIDYAKLENVDIEFVEEDMRRFKRSDSFDLIINLWSSFGYFEDPIDDIQVLKNVFDSLRMGGQFLLDVRGKEIHAMDNQVNYSHEMPNGDLIFHRTKVKKDWTGTYATWAYIQGDRAHTFKVNYNLYSGAELRNLLRSVGFADVHIYGDLKGTPYDHKATRLVVLASKNEL